MCHYRNDYTLWAKRLFTIFFDLDEGPSSFNTDADPSPKKVNGQIHAELLCAFAGRYGILSSSWGGGGWVVGVGGGGRQC
jgi:hypothetical protein